MTPRHFKPILAFLAALAAAACGALKPPKAQFATIYTSPIVYALNGAAPGTPSGISFLTGASVVVDANFYFNVALDIDSAGKVVILPARRVANGLSGTLSVGLQPVTGTFDDYTQARKSGYTFDSTLVVPVGQVVGVNVLDNSTCTVYSLGSSYYAKFIVDSIDLPHRAIYTEIVSDANCGYVSLGPGVPTK
jgi:hypothetical protein